MNKNDVLIQIRSAFSGVVLGKGIGLWEAQAIDDYDTEDVQKANREKDEKSDWRLISHHDLQQCHSSLSFFDADGMRFHLPAYIIASMDNRVDDPLFHLIQLDDYALSKWTSINQAQRRAIISYLKWCIEQEQYDFERISIIRALNEYWEVSE